MASKIFRLTATDGVEYEVELEVAGQAPSSGPPVPQPEPAPLVGCMFGAHVGGSGAAEVQWGKKIPKKVILIREYHQWELPSSTTLNYLKTGHVVMTSHKPPAVRGGGAVDGWKKVFEGAEDEKLRAIAKAYAPHAGRVIFVFHHEPHDDGPNDGNLFVAAFRRAANVMRSYGISVGYCGVPSRVTSSKGDPFYPGDAWVDVECHDPYNWYQYQGSRSWRTPAERLDPLVKLADRRGHPLILGEINSHPGDEAHSRKEWYRQLVEYAKAHPTLRGLCLYDTVHTHDWRATPDELSVFKDPYMLSTPLPLPCGPVIEPKKTPDGVDD